AEIRLEHRECGCGCAAGPRAWARHICVRRRRRTGAVHGHYQRWKISRVFVEPRDGTFDWARTLLGHHAHGKLEPPADYSYDQCEPVARYVGLRRTHCRYARRDPDGHEPVVVHRRPTLPISVFHGNWLGN